jgi:hypothetical protein
MTLLCLAECVIVLNVKETGSRLYHNLNFISIKNVRFALIRSGILEIPIKGLVYRMTTFALM